MKVLETLASVFIVFIVVATFLGHDFGWSNENSAPQTVATTEDESNLIFLDEAAQADGCIADGTQPDKRCTPGVVLANHRPLCLSISQRPIPAQVAKLVWQRYQIEVDKRKEYRLSRLVPKALGGADHSANIFPIGKDSLGWEEKAQAGYHFWNHLCQGQDPLEKLQDQLARNWTLVWETITVDELVANRGLTSNRAAARAWF